MVRRAGTQAAKGLDCKSGAFGLRRFESYPSHSYSRKPLVDLARGFVDFGPTRC
jgi:hypothetical protein